MSKFITTNTLLVIDGLRVEVVTAEMIEGEGFVTNVHVGPPAYCWQLMLMRQTSEGENALEEAMNAHGNLVKELLRGEVNLVPAK